MIGVSVKFIPIPTLLARTDAVGDVVRLSLEKFRWKTEGLIDPLEALFDDDLIFVHITGRPTSKAEWIDELRSGRFVYEAIDAREASVAAHGETAVLVGRAAFTVSMGGRRARYDLIYTEVYVRKGSGWSLTNIHTCQG
jgi:hypothetical protein